MRFPRSDWGIRTRVSVKAKASGANLPPDMANLKVWLDPDDIDGVGNATMVDGAAITSWLNKGTLGGTFAQVTPSRQPTFVGAGLNGKPVVNFDGTDMLDSSLPPSAFTFLHDATGSTIYTVARTASNTIQTILATTTGNNTSTGMGHRLVVGPTASFFVINGAAVAQNITGGTPALGSYHVQVSSLGTAATPDAALDVDGVNVNSSDPAAAYATTDPNGTLRVGASVATAFFFTGRLAPVFVFGVAHDSTTKAAVVAWLTSKYGTFPVAA